MIEFSINDEIKRIFPDIQVGILTGDVENSTHNENLWSEIDKECEAIRESFDMESIRAFPPITAGKNAYRSLGKDPNRYRISSEALLRRITKGRSLYQIHSLVDALNLVSIRTGVTIGGFDLTKVIGPVSLGIGKENEEFEAIGRGQLNIHRLPVYRDQSGAIGSPTSDCTRTMLQADTGKFLMIITGFYGSQWISETLEELKKVLEKHVSGRNFDVLPLPLQS